MAKAFAILALIVLGGFLAILILKLDAIDLTIVCAIAFLMACWDIWLTFKPKRRPSRSPAP